VLFIFLTLGAEEYEVNLRHCFGNLEIHMERMKAVGM
jgi:hypothetical protein